MRSFALFLAFALLAVPTAVSAQSLQSLTFKNTTGSPAWITFYGNVSTDPKGDCQTLISGLSNSCTGILTGAFTPRCVPGFSSYTYPASNNSFLEFRAQVIKGHGNCSEATFHDLHQNISVGSPTSGAIQVTANPKVELDLQGTNTFLLNISP